MKSWLSLILFNICLYVCPVYGAPSDRGESFLCLPTEECNVVDDASIAQNNTIHISLMQSPQEKKIIHLAKKEWENKQHAPPKPEELPPPIVAIKKNDDAIVTGILYTSPKVWSIWIGEHVYNQDQDRLDDLLGEISTIRAKNSSVVEITQKDKTYLVFLGHSLHHMHP